MKAGKYFNRYCECIYILFHTGLRISEFVGLSVSDMDLENGRIKVEHQLKRKAIWNILRKKTSGTRVIPMTDEVKTSFVNLIKNKKRTKVEPIIDGKTSVLYLDKNIMPIVALHWEKYFKHI